MEQEPFVDVAAASRSTGIPPRTIRRWIQDGRLHVEEIAGVKHVHVGAVIRAASARGRAVITGRGHATEGEMMARVGSELAAGQWPQPGKELLRMLEERIAAELAAKDELIVELRRRAELAEAELGRLALPPMAASYAPGQGEGFFYRLIRRSLSGGAK